MFACAPTPARVPHDQAEGPLVGVNEVTETGDDYVDIGRRKGLVLPSCHARLSPLQMRGLRILSKCSRGGGGGVASKSESPATSAGHPRCGSCVLGGVLGFGARMPRSPWGSARACSPKAPC